MLTPAEAADYLHVHPETIRRRIRRGELRAYRIGPRAVRIDVRDLQASARPISATTGGERR
ncbi:helix-turn-helix domain-containing protein [Brachybacterium sp. Marseille-Q2903]|uniref:Helix-turn-helix domain-containing protein n=1 Tax=Brachybacterium epidermidis TaxID=2781983 RepID=A0ABR9W236_9MICO|nr:helix-turn-helix domain-containing protein [Brachybacterium epidermidis]